MKFYVSVLLAGSFLFSTGCTLADKTAAKEDQLPVTQCVDPRPQMCIMNYLPVCGIFKDGREKTFSNGCSACSNEAVISYRTGSCTD